RGRGIDGQVACRDCRRAALENAMRKLVLASLEMAGNDCGGGDGSCCDQASGGQGCEQNPARPMNVENAGYIFRENPDGGRMRRIGPTGGNCDGTDSLPGKGAQVSREDRLCGRGYRDPNPPAA